MKNEKDDYESEDVIYELHTEDMTDKKISIYEALATGKIYTNELVYDAIKNKKEKFDNVLMLAGTSGMSAVKKTYDLLPLYHMKNVTNTKISFRMDQEKVMKDLNSSTISNLIEKYVGGGKIEYETKYFIECSCFVKCKTFEGVESEALMGVNTTLLTIYDLCKNSDKNMVISDVHISEKNGAGKNYDSSDELNQLIFI